jgi:hypothetical protein
MKDVDEQFNHPQPVKHSDNEKSKLPHRRCAAAEEETRRQAARRVTRAAPRRSVRA